MINSFLIWIKRRIYKKWSIKEFQNTGIINKNNQLMEKQRNNLLEMEQLIRREIKKYNSNVADERIKEIHLKVL